MTTRFAHRSFAPATNALVVWLLVLLLASAFTFAGDQPPVGTRYPSGISPAEVFL